MTVEFDRTPEEDKIIHDIAKRAAQKAREAGFEITALHFHMDISAVHSNGCPLKLKELAVADDFNFNHDVFGIYRHLNRDTGQLENCFLPRFSA